MSKLTDSLNKIQSLEELAEGKTLIHHIHPMAKMITTIVYLVVVISFGKYNISGLIPFFIYPVVLMSIGEIPYRSVLARLIIALPFSFFAGLSNPFLDRETAYMFFSFSISWGILSFTSIILKTILTVMAVLILIATTPMDEIAHQLIRIKIPKIFVMQLMLTYRYISLLISEASNMITAYHLRSKLQKGIKLEHAGTFMGQLLLRSFERSEKVYLAMKCRGFNGEYQFASAEKIKGSDFLYFLALCLIFILMKKINFSILLGSFFG